MNTDEPAFQLVPRDPAYWESLRQYMKKHVEKLSAEVEAIGNWQGTKPWISFRYNGHPNATNAYIRRVRDHAEIGLSLGLLLRFDEAARWINQHPQFRGQLRMTRLGNHDFSKWIIWRWCDWIFRHEAAHFLCGHLLIADAQWTEGEPQQGRDVELIRAMEADADIIAASLYFGALYRHFEKRIYQDFYRSDDLNDVFWDIGMIFGVLFVLLEDMNPHGRVRSHPTAAQRLTIFFVEGMSTYAGLSIAAPASEWTAMLSGLSYALVFLEPHGAQFAAAHAKSSLEVEKWKNILIKAKVQDGRFLKFSNDWLLRKTPSEHV